MLFHWNIKYLCIYLAYYDTIFRRLSGCLAKTNVVSSGAIKLLMSFAIPSVSVALMQSVGQLVTLTSSTCRHSFRKSKPLVMLSYGELLPHMTRKPERHQIHFQRPGSWWLCVCMYPVCTILYNCSLRPIFVSISFILSKQHIDRALENDPEVQMIFNDYWPLDSLGQFDACFITWSVPLLNEGTPLSFHDISSPFLSGVELP